MTHLRAETEATCAVCAAEAAHPIESGRHLCSGCLLNSHHADLFPDCGAFWHNVFDHSPLSRRLARPADPDVVEILRTRGVAEDSLDGITQLVALDLLSAVPDVPPSVPVDTRWARGPMVIDRHRDPVEEVHLVDGAVARIRRTADGERYAERWDETSRRYGPHEPGLVERTTEATRLDAEGASHHGRAWGHCMVCGRILTNATSVRAGIGPVCVVNVYGHDARAEIGGEGA